MNDRQQRGCLVGKQWPPTNICRLCLRICLKLWCYQARGGGTGTQKHRVLHSASGRGGENCRRSENCPAKGPATARSCTLTSSDGPEGGVQRRGARPMFNLVARCRVGRARSSSPRSAQGSQPRITTDALGRVGLRVQARPLQTFELWRGRVHPKNCVWARSGLRPRNECNAAHICPVRRCTARRRNGSWLGTLKVAWSCACAFPGGADCVDS